ncbi:methylated-DNA--[protein]-cysteine S-methyltransferase [bacterium]|nr:methylated-DNA--[protein]-cysteine S-methyltransferase [bacterium]
MLEVTLLEDTILGNILIACDKLGLRHVRLDVGKLSSEILFRWGERVENNGKSALEAADYFRQYLTDGDSSIFSQLPLSPECMGDGFPKAVYSALLTVPSGETVTYGELALMAGRPRAARAVGTIMGRNDVAIYIPCHRVVPASGGIGQYGGGEHLKEILLRLEKAEIIMNRREK